MTRKSLIVTPGFEPAAKRRSPQITPKLIAAAVTTSLLVACGGGGGGGATTSNAATRTINDANEKQVVAAAMRVIALSENGTEASASSSASVTVQRNDDRLLTTVPPMARAAQPVPNACTSGRMLVDDVTGEEIYENCEFMISGRTIRFNGSVLTEDLRGDATSEYDTRVSYNDYSIAILLNSTDHITNVLSGVALDSYSDTGDRGEADIRLAATFVCQGVSGSYGAEIQMSTVSERVGDESSYTENGQITFNGLNSFNGDLTVTTLEPMRYRDDTNDANPYAGRVRFAAADGSAVELSFAEGGLYVDNQFYTWDQYNSQFFVSDALAPCLTP